MKIGLIQMKVAIEKDENIQKACRMIEKAAGQGADIAVLPEMFNCPYDNRYFEDYAETSSGDTLSAMKTVARKFGIYIIAGSIPEVDGDDIFNTSFVLDSDGNVIAKHRKMHLFDIDVKDGIRFFESDTLTRGDDLTVFDTPYGKIGLAICYDMRFPELMRLMAIEGAEMIVIPAAFNRITGPAHWKTTVRARALDNQVYFAAVSPAVDWDASYHAYGHTVFVDPWGDVVEELGDEEGMIVCETQKGLIEKVRKELPLLKHRRTDLYDLKISRKELK